MDHPSVVGLIGPQCVLRCRAVWNAFFKEQGSPLEFQFYRTRNREELELRLSEMFVLRRLGYVVHPDFQTTILPLLDELDATAQKAQQVDTIVNDGGRLIGHFLDAEACEAQEVRMRLWMQSAVKKSYIG